MTPLRFALLGHPYSTDHLRRILQYHQPDLHPVSDGFIRHAFEWSDPYSDVYLPFTSATGQTIEGWYVTTPVVPDSSPKLVVRQTLRALEFAERLGANVCALGAYTSLVGERYPEQIPSTPSFTATTGNIYTTALTLEGVTRITDRLHRDLADLHILIVGTSDIGIGSARWLAPRCRRLTMASRNPRKRKALINELTDGTSADNIHIVGDMREAVPDADITIMSVNVFDPSFDFSLFKPGAIIVDVGYPKNVAYYFESHRHTRPDLFVYCGGYAHMPDRIDYGFDLGLPEPHITYGCFGEGLILALENRCEPFSIGRGGITESAIQEILTLGRKHGFDVAPPYLGTRQIPDDVIDRFAHAHPKP